MGCGTSSTSSPTVAPTPERSSAVASSAQKDARVTPSKSAQPGIGESPTVQIDNTSNISSKRSFKLAHVGEESFLSNLVTRKVGSITSEYIIHDERALGTGMTCTVKVITHKTTGKEYALKAIRINRLQQDKIAELRREIEIMKVLDHPNIVKLYQTFEDRSCIYLVMELCTGGELFDRLAEQKASKFTENDAAVLISKMVAAINYLHMRNICHRDLKLENFIFENSRPDAEIKLIDFGLSKVYSEGSAMKNVLGTSYYVAPEVLKGSYGIECDLWGIGVLSFMLLSGQAPFGGETDADILKLVKKGHYSFKPERVWNGVSSEAKDFVRKLLVINPEERMTAKQALGHSWLSRRRETLMTAENSAEISDEIYKNLKSYKTFGALKRAALVAIAFSLNQDEIEQARAQFEILDTEKNGIVRLSQLKIVLQEHGVAEAEIMAIFKNIDTDHSGAIDYSEFIAAAMQKRIYLDEERLYDAFHRLDTEGSGFLTQAGLEKVLGGSYSSDDVSVFASSPSLSNEMLHCGTFIQGTKSN